MTDTTTQTHIQARRSDTSGFTAPDLMAALKTRTTVAAPLTTERRRELIEELVEWSTDPDAHDWDYVNKLD
jgi:hypothetical protein